MVVSAKTMRERGRGRTDDGSVGEEGHRTVGFLEHEGLLPLERSPDPVLVRLPRPDDYHRLAIARHRPHYTSLSLPDTLTKKKRRGQTLGNVGPDGGLAGDGADQLTRDLALLEQPDQAGIEDRVRSLEGVEVDSLSSVDQSRCPSSDRGGEDAHGDDL